MNSEKVISILAYYKDAADEIKLNERIIRSIEDQHYCSMGAVNNDGMPKSKGGYSNPVERTALNVPRNAADEINEIKKNNEKLERVRNEILKELNRLAYNRKAIIFSFYIDKKQWEYISSQLHYCPRQCRNIRDAAVAALSKSFAQNRIIAKYRFPEN